MLCPLSFLPSTACWHRELWPSDAVKWEVLRLFPSCRSYTAVVDVVAVPPTPVFFWLRRVGVLGATAVLSVLVLWSGLRTVLLLTHPACTVFHYIDGVPSVLGGAVVPGPAAEHHEHAAGQQRRHHGRQR
jgi:hypothetical protein